MRPLYLLFPLILGAAACALPADGGPGSTASQGRKQCFRSSQVSGFSDAGPNVALVNIGGRETWELALSPGCPDVDFAMRLGIRARGGSDRVCSGTDAELLIPPASGRGFQRCLIRSVRKLSPEEMAVARGETPRR